MGVAQQWIEGDEQSAAICVFTASHDDPFSHSISFSFLPSEAVAHLFFWVLFSFGCEDRLIAAATFLACNNVLLGVEKRRRSADGRGEEMLDPDISTRSINRTPPRGSLTGIVGLFTRKKTLHRSPNPSFHRAHLSSVPALRPTFPGNCFIAVFAVIFPFEKWDWGDWGQGFGHGRGVRKLGTKIFNLARRSKTIVAPCGPCRS